MAEKKGLIHRFIVGTDKSEGHARSTLPSNRKELFFDIFKGRFWKLVLLNLMALLAFAPMIFLLYLHSAQSAAVGTSLPFSSGMVFGYPFMPNLVQQAAYLDFMSSLQIYAMLVVALLFAGVILSGIFYIFRNLVWSEAVFLANDWWKGFKTNIGGFLGISLLFGAVLFITNFNLMTLNNASVLGQTGMLTSSFWNGLLRALSIIFFGFFLIMTFFALTINVTYKVSFWQLLRNSFILTLGLLPRNIVFLAFALLPFLLLLLFPGTMISSLLMGIIILVGFSFALLIWSIYSHWVFDTFLNDKVEGAVKNRGLYEKVDKQGNPVVKKEKGKTAFQNPKKKKPVKPVTDDEIQITELPATFSRKDLQKLADEKEVMARDSEKWSEEHADGDYDSDDADTAGGGGDEDGAYIGYEDALKLEGYDGDGDGSDAVELETEDADGAETEDDDDNDTDSDYGTDTDDADDDEDDDGDDGDGSDGE